MIGQVIGGYEIIEVLGRGGMGVVFKAMDTSLEKTVALKALHPAQAQDEQFLARFKSEARTLGRLQHPHIVNVFAFRHVEPHLFIVMEYVGGGSLSELISARGALPWKEALPIIRQTLEAMSYAHQAHVVHRDIKPRNILLTEAGAVKVTDFGLAKIQGGTSDSKALTRTGFTGGTLYYMPPEQLEGLHRVDHRSDVYSLGMTFYELLAGRVPFNKNISEFKILKSIDTHDFPPIDQVVSGLPEPLVRLVTKALEHEQEDRFQRVDEMLEALKDGALAPTSAPFSQTIAPSPLAATRVINRPLPFPEEPHEQSKGDSSSLLKSLKSLWKSSSGSWRVGRGDAKEAEPVAVEDDRRASASAGVDSSADATAILATPYQPSKLPVASGASPAAASAPAKRPARSAPRPGAPRADRRTEQAAVSSRWARPILAVSVLAALLAVGFWLNSVRSPEAQAPGGPGPASLSIRTLPADATVYLDGRRIGTTPLASYEVAAGAGAIRIEKDGFAPFDTSITLLGGEAPSFTFALASASVASSDAGDDTDEAAPPALGTAALVSEPSGAEVWLDGRRVGTTPFTVRDLQPGTHRFVLRSEGYEDYAAPVRIEAAREARVTATLTALRGTLRVLVRPFGDIYIDGDVKGRATNAPHVEEVEAGTHRVRAVHPALGTWEKDVVVRGNAQEEVLFNFNQEYRVLVTSNPSNAEIIVDGQAVGRNTPSQVPLRPGRHSIEVRKEGFRMAGSPQTITLERDMTDTPMSFQLRQP